MASACDAASWLVTETLLTLIATYFFLLMKGLIWSSMAASASAMFLRRLSPLTSETTDFVSGAACSANGAQAGARAANRIISRRVERRDVMERPPKASYQLSAISYRLSPATFGGGLVWLIADSR